VVDVTCRGRSYPLLRYLLFIPNTDPEFLPIPDPGSRGKKGTGSVSATLFYFKSDPVFGYRTGIRIRNLANLDNEESTKFAKLIKDVQAGEILYYCRM
jgi:hypothetical protein